MQYAKKSLPSRERGLKSICSGRKHTRPSVAPLAGAWIEIIRTAIFHPFSESLPSRERGLKYHVNLKHCPVSLVAPLAGAWIEIFCVDPFRMCFRVAPLAGAWIEMS